MPVEAIESAALSAVLASKIYQRQASVGVIGMGYVGLPLALLFAEKGFPVTGFDIDESKIEALSKGNSYIYRIPSEDVSHAITRGFQATSRFDQLSRMNAILICVPTPLNEHFEPDLSYIVSTLNSVAPHVQPGQLIILESTTYPGTTEEIVVSILEGKNQFRLTAERNGESEDTTFHVAFSPEREDPGNDNVKRHDIPKVVGGVGPKATELACALYGSVFNRTVPVSSPKIAEMSKLLENIYRCVNIAMVNELKLLCLRMGVDVWEVIEAASTKPFGFQPFYPGPGLGGHCIPVDPFYLSWRAKELDFHTRFIELAGEINTAMPYHVVEAVSSALNDNGLPLMGAEVLILGVAYKRDVDDLRESPALTIIEQLNRRGAIVSYNDPYIPFIGKGRKYSLNMASTSLEGLERHDCVVIVTDHSDYDYPKIVREARLLVDTRNATRGISSPKIVRC